MLLSCQIWLQSVERSKSYSRPTFYLSKMAVAAVLSFVFNRIDALNYLQFVNYSNSVSNVMEIGDF